jgi:hypothetical protein
MWSDGARTPSPYSKETEIRRLAYVFVVISLVHFSFDIYSRYYPAFPSENVHAQCSSQHPLATVAVLRGDGPSSPPTSPPTSAAASVTISPTRLSPFGLSQGENPAPPGTVATVPPSTVSAAPPAGSIATAAPPAPATLNPMLAGLLAQMVSHIDRPEGDSSQSRVRMRSGI